MTVQDEATEGRTTADAHRSTVDGDWSTVSVYRWTCPICDESRTGIASGNENPLAKAAFSLRQHVRTSVDDDHGPANVFPPEFDPDAAGSAVSVE